MRECCPINYCGRGPKDVICEGPPVRVKKTETNFYHPCPGCCKCPDYWPTLVPKVRGCLQPVPVHCPPACPVMPQCQTLRMKPIKCGKNRPPLPDKIYPPVIPCCKLCKVPVIPPNPKPPRTRYLNPCIPCCPPRPCPPKPIYPPEPPYPPYCPVFAPCICPDRPLIVHDSVRKFRITSDCKKIDQKDDPKVCYLPIAGEELGQVNYFMGTCYKTCCP